ncbi:hypothetical protein QAD02_011507 [Eretmocerus hayati]|uniref:Uncharacterized protein n=1 Tax=Eretmocerus hayati TaxID=131215 RepID=A0ACC2NY51_9HYME|nr:hypothetical protein QAD02_011507 [Eretmocerus hayati]
MNTWCVNPFEKENHKVTKGLVNVPKNISENDTRSLYKQQELKINLQPGQFIVCFDFAENYAFVVQNSAQSFHWNNNQATIFTVVIYYVENGELKHKSLAIISDNLAHDTYSVYQYQKIIIEYLRENFELVMKIFYVTDEASRHFKNKSNFANLVAHTKDFGVVAEWHFHATAHGKGACDGIGANLKRGAKQASSQCSSQHHILTPQSLFEWAKSIVRRPSPMLSSLPLMVWGCSKSTLWLLNTTSPPKKEGIERNESNHQEKKDPGKEKLSDKTKNS